jgi:hypothetical protein
MLPELTQDEFGAALDAVACDVLESALVAEPPVDALAVATSLGLTVAWDDRQQGRARVVRLGSVVRPPAPPSILLRPDPRRERLQWAVAHEIGETCACQVFDRLGVEPREAPAGTRETVANQLAARLLLPGIWFAKDGVACGWDLVALKRRYATASHELIARRMLDFGPRIVVTIFDHGKRTYRRGNLGGRIPPWCVMEMMAWRAAHTTSRRAVEASHVCRVHAWPVHEPDWKREIVRTEWLLDDEPWE